MILQEKLLNMFTGILFVFFCIRKFQKKLQVVCQSECKIIDFKSWIKKLQKQIISHDLMCNVSHNMCLHLFAYYIVPCPILGVHFIIVIESFLSCRLFKLMQSYKLFFTFCSVLTISQHKDLWVYLSHAILSLTKFIKKDNIYDSGWKIVRSIMIFPTISYCFDVVNFNNNTTRTTKYSSLKQVGVT